MYKEPSITTPSYFFHTSFSSSKYTSPYLEDKLIASFFLYVYKHDGILVRFFNVSPLILTLMGSINTEISGLSSRKFSTIFDPKG